MVSTSRNCLAKVHFLRWLLQAAIIQDATAFLLPLHKTLAPYVTSTSKQHSLTITHAIQIPSWQEIESTLQTNTFSESLPLDIDSTLSPSTPPSYPEDRPTLFRERHGWCPYSERVWLALELKAIPYHTIRIENSGFGRRPSYFGGSTPQMRWDDGRMQGESMDLVRQIQERYPNHGMNLYPDRCTNQVINMSRAFDSTFPKRSRPSSRAAFLFRYDGEPLWKNEFEKVLMDTNNLLGETEGPFFCGMDITAADVAWAPFLERYAAQLPCLHDGLNPRTDSESYPNLVKWYNAMEESIPAYACRVQGNASSWRKVLVMAGYGNAGLPPQTVGRMEEMDLEECKALSMEEETQQQAIWNAYREGRSWVASSPSREAAHVMVRNREAIVMDALKRANGENQLPTTEEELDQVIRAMVCALDDIDGVFDRELINQCRGTRGVKALASFLDERMCVPRDMGSFSAAAIKRLAAEV